MKNLLISLIISAGLIGTAHAGDAEAGKVKSATCAACHGGDGNSMAPTFPKIAGQGERYLIKQISDIRDGNRAAPAMAPFVTGLSDEDIADLAAYFSAQVPTGGGADENLVALGESIYRGGIESKNVTHYAGREVSSQFPATVWSACCLHRNAAQSFQQW